MSNKLLPYHILRRACFEEIVLYFDECHILKNIFCYGYFPIEKILLVIF